MRLRDSTTGQFVSFDDYIAREGEGITIEGTKTITGDEPFDYPDYNESEDMDMDFDDMDMYP